MQITYPFLRYLYSLISPLFPFYYLGLTPGQVLWPVIFVPIILAANFLWAVFLSTFTVVVLGQAERVGQRLLIRYALWATAAEVIIDSGHDITLIWLGQRIDFLLEPQPWYLIAGTYALPCALLFFYHWLLSWQYLRLRVWQAAIMGATFALLTAPWTTLVVIDVGQGRLPVPAQRWLWIGLLVASIAPWLLARAIARMSRVRGRRRVGSGIMLAGLAVALAVGGGATWLNATRVSAMGAVGVSADVGNLAFTNRGRVYAVQGGDGHMLSLARLRGDIVAWSPNLRFLLVNERRSDGKDSVSVIAADQSGVIRSVGLGSAGPGAWSPDSLSILYTSTDATTSQIHIVRADGSGDRVLAEGRSPSWSADGRRIAYSARVAGRWQVWVMLPTGEDALQLTSDGGEDPIWSPDGRFIAYVQNNRVQVMDADGTNKRRLPVDNAFLDSRPSLYWAGDGTRLAYIYTYPPESGRPTQIYIWDTSTPALPLGGVLPPVGTPTVTGSSGKGLNRSGDYRPPFGWSPNGVWLGFTRHGEVWGLNVLSGEERRLIPGDTFAWGGRSPNLVVRPAPTYPPTPTPTPLPASVIESPSVLVLDPRDPTIILAGTANGVVRKTDKSGWMLSSMGINIPSRVRALVYDPTDSRVVYAGTDGQRAIGGGLYKSTDGGVRWTLTSLKDVDIYQIVIDPRQPASLYAGTSKGVYVSRDAGATWSERNSGLKTTTIVTLAVDPAAPRATGRGTPTAGGPIVYLGTRQGEIYKSLNGGTDWRLVQNVNAPITSLLVYIRRPDTIFATTEDGLFSSTDGGETWNQVSGGIWKIRLSGLVAHPVEDTIWAYGAPGVFVSHDGGVNWGPAAVGLEGTQPSALVINTAEPTILYVGTDKGIFRTNNGGVTWSR